MWKIAIKMEVIVTLYCYVVNACYKMYNNHHLTAIIQVNLR